MSTTTTTSMSSSSSSSNHGAAPGRGHGKQSGRFTQEFVSLADIRREVEKKTKVQGFAPIAIIGSANNQADLGRTKEDAGDINEAIYHYLNALSLFNSAYEHRDYKLESQAASSKASAAHREISLFKQARLPDLTRRTQTLIAKQKELEAQYKPLESQELVDGPDQQPGGTLKDRMRLLQGAGMAVDVVKNNRATRDRSPSLPPAVIPSVASPPHTPQSSGSPALGSSMPNATPGTPRSFVSLSTLGPPSPTSSPSSAPSLPTSPRSHNLASASPGPSSIHVPTASEFASQFPSIDELDERDAEKFLPSPPSHVPSFPLVPSSKIGGISGLPPPISPSIRHFPSLMPDPTPRPASTPIPLIAPMSNSRPPSPPHPGPSGHSRAPAHVRDSPSPTPTPNLPPISSAITPSDLLPYLRTTKVLMIDVRNRTEFEQAHVKHNTIICLEPSILTRNNVNSAQILEAMVLSPQSESTLFENRDKFDLVIIYDQKSVHSDEMKPSPIIALERAIYEEEFRTVLKRPPMLLIGGFDAWVKQCGEPTIDGADVKTVLAMAHARQATPAHGVSHISRTLGPRPISGALPSTPVSVLTSAPAAGLQGSEMPPTIDSSEPQLPAGKKLVRKPALRSQLSGQMRAPESASSSSVSLSQSATSTPALSNGILGSIQYPQPTMSPPSATYRPSLSPSGYGPTGLPQAALSSFAVSGRRSDYTEQSQHSYSGSISSMPPVPRAPIDYPQLTSHHPVIRPPPAAATPAIERPRANHEHSYSTGQLHAPPPMIKSDYPVLFWRDSQVGTSGLKNLGNTCYMNSTLQCLSATVPFAQFFTDGRWKSAVNMVNPLGTRGALANAFAKMVYEMWQGDQVYIAPYPFRKSICNFAQQFGGSDQHDSQEFLSFLLDGLHEDLNRIIAKPVIETRPEREQELETLPQQIASEQEWRIYRLRNDSIVVDYFQGQFRNRMTCLTCSKTSTTYNTFMYLSLPIPSGRKATLYQCVEAFVKAEVMEKTDAWHCPNCKTLRRATKHLSLSRLPPVLMIHLKRFSFKGPFTDKLETLVDFPLKGLDLTNYMPAPLPPGVDKTQLYGSQAGPSSADPRSQIPPYKYDLYAVTNHFGSLSSGHYTAHVASAGGWLYCDDSRVAKADKHEVVGKPAYMLFYKRVQA